jgi:hypothetical protein
VHNQGGYPIQILLRAAYLFFDAQSTVIIDIDTMCSGEKENSVDHESIGGEIK